ncbi:MAG: murein hydrolase activator EnvC family protein [Pseudonocardiaceae bacterium]
MRADARPRRSRPLLPLLGLLVAAISSTWLGTSPAWSADPRLERARSHREAVQARLDDLLQRVEAVHAKASAAESELESLTRAQAAQQQVASAAFSALSEQILDQYKHGSVDPALTILSSGSPQETLQRAQLVSLLTRRSKARIETASSARARMQATAVQVARTAQTLRAQKADIDALRQRVTAELAKAQQVEDQVQAKIAGERASPARPSRSRIVPDSVAGVPGLVVGSVSCPVGQPRHYSNTWGAPRSGGRTHKGVDVLAPRGTPIYAYEKGTIVRMGTNGLGGITLYLNGDSGNQYYYAHLRGYVNSIGTGRRVTAGQHIAFVGDTGNARGIPHLHLEVRPGGRANVNPYPFTRRACG